MSGGAFNYVQYQITDPVHELKDMAADEHWPEDVRESMLKCIKVLQEASIRLHRIDWLVSDDDGIETYRERLKRDLEELK
jgi:hypothetical protein